MFKRAVSWTAISLVALLLASCGGNADASADAPSEPGRSETTSTTQPPTTSTTIPPPYSFDGSVPPPKLINTGTNYEAIFRSLSSYGRWLLAHNPDAALLSNVLVVGTPVYGRYESDIRTAARNDVRLIDVADRLEVRVVDVALPIVSLRVTEHVDKVQSIARDGSVKDEGDYSAPLEWVATLQLDASGRWRIGAIESADGAHT